MTQSPRLDTVRDFDLRAPLPWGDTTVLEASAGTGKTYTIASLTARYLAEGTVRLENMMLVTFGRMATQELRDRVRGRLVEIERALGDPQAAGSVDPVIAGLAAVDAAEVAIRRARLATALASFDEATIATTHSFCQRMLAGLGISADNEPGTSLLQNSGDLLQQVADDEYLRQFADLEVPPFDAVTALRIARDAVGISRAVLAPADADPESPAGQRVRYAEGVREAFELRKRDARVLDFDDLQVRLSEALAHPVRGAAAREMLRAAFRVVLVDEFQDTDPVQWDILRAAFHGHSTLVLIGDPKQSIYAFRGADVFTYLQAVRTAGNQATLGRNWRSDGPLVRGLDHLWGGFTLGDEEIRIRPIEAQHHGSRLVVPGRPAPIRIRRLPRNRAQQSRGGLCLTKGAIAAVASDVAAEVVELLQSAATVTVDGVQRSITPADIAVLVHRNEQGELVRDALRALGVPVVLTGNTSVFASEAARHWATLLDTLESPNRAAKARAAALTPFLGWDGRRLATADADAIDALIDDLQRWARVLGSGGISALLETTTVEGLATRVLGQPDGDRLLTDIRHIAGALNAASRTEHLGPAALLEWLRRRMEESGAEAPEELSRRLSSEDAAVQVLTVHRSKGLEFGAVFVPFGWARWLNDTPEPLHLHDEQGRQILDVGGPAGPGYLARLPAHNAELLGEDLRLLYVAFTRARSLLVTWWVPGTTTKNSPLHRVLFGEPVDGALPVGVSFGQDAAVADKLAARVAPAGELIAVEVAEPGRTPQYRAAVTPVVSLTVRTFERELDTSWRRTSYSGLTAAAHAAHYDHPELRDDPAPTGGQDVSADESAITEVDPATGTEPESPGVIDEFDAGTSGTPVARVPSSAVIDEASLRAVSSSLEAFPGGTAFGSVVHEILEYLDTTATDLPAQLLAHCQRVVGTSSGSSLPIELDAAALATGLEPVFRTPLGPLADGRTLAQISPADRLAEMTFEIPLAGGDAATAGSQLTDLADVWQAHVGADDLLADYPELLRDKLLAGEPLRGYLGGSIDAVLRIAGGRSGGSPRYLVADYKTNRLGVPGEPLSAWDYRPAAMAEAMMAAHYPLQSLLYTVALHRYLRWRQPGYQPDSHLGGSLYLFVRGMSGPGTPVIDEMPCGVFAWRPSAALVTAASAVLAGGDR